MIKRSKITDMNGNEIKDGDILLVKEDGREEGITELICIVSYNIVLNTWFVQDAITNYGCNLIELDPDEAVIMGNISDFNKLYSDQKRDKV